MPTKKEDIFNQIYSITRKLIKEKISIRYNFPTKEGNGIKWEQAKNLAFSLKEEPYEVIYKACSENGDYNFMLLDGSIVQMQYRFNGNGKQLLAHILAFYPNPNFEKYQDNPEEYEETYFDSKQLFTDIRDESTVVFPIRFDYDSAANKHIDCDHPKVHTTFGNYQNCRLPVVKPISPNRFILFVLRNFYFNKFKECLNNDDFTCNLNFDDEITAQEKKLLHFNFI